MKDKYDFSKGERGKFYSPDAEFVVPIYLEPDVIGYLSERAESKGLEVGQLINDMVRREIPSLSHIELRDGEPYIAGTTMKIVELVDSKEAYGWGPEELHFHFPHLTLGMVYGALAYYWDHKEEVDSDRERRLRLAEEYRLQDGPSPLAAKIRALRLKT